MDGAFVLGSENSVAGDDMTKGVVKGSKIGSAARRKLADISNLQQRPKMVNQEAKQLPISLTTKEYVEKLQKENMTLMKLLAERNKIIELSGIELQKLRINLQKMQQQNLQLAQANSQMLAELNLGKDRLKALQHELGCKNGLLNARKLDLEVKAKRLRCQNTGNEVGTSKCNEAGESSQADKGDYKPCHTNRRRQSKNQSLVPTTAEPVPAKENVENKRLCLRRQSARFKSEESEPTEHLFEIDKASGPTIVKLVHTKEHADKKRRSRRQSARFKSEEPEPNEDLLCNEAGESSQADKGDYEPCHTNRRQQSENQSLGSTTVEPVHAKENVENKRRCLRRQSARSKSEESEPTEDLFEIDKASGPTIAKLVHIKEQGDKKRRHSRRQSARFKSEEPGPIEDLFEIDKALGPTTLKPVHHAKESIGNKRSKSEEPEQSEDFFEIHDAKFPVSPLIDDSVHETDPMAPALSIKKEDEGNTALSLEAQEIRRSSVGRPLRRAAEKIQSYKEISINVKMRRQQDLRSGSLK
ncbi:SHUGOSHIN 2 isoform X2 [Alnus glutinosa]|uniref:SHUGOSHIN 2 isoform X2 n=1 Tax=Alnus glutinosa TaxID=3517 RepID=UPI002D791EA7|nr:SHUGOSHIN 2 isoform X2 [Alnus glutinosa]